MTEFKTFKVGQRVIHIGKDVNGVKHVFVVSEVDRNANIKVVKAFVSMSSDDEILAFGCADRKEET